MRFAYLFLFILSTQVFATDPNTKKSITDFTKDMQYQRGFFEFYYQIETDKVFLKIDKFEQPFLFQGRIFEGAYVVLFWFEIIE